MNPSKEFSLYEIAEDQAGYFSLAQARELGLQRNQIYRELERGKFERAAWGVYRFVQFPASRFEAIHVAVLHAGEEAVVGFDTALYIYDLSDLIPDEIHLILPRTSSRRRTGIRMHTTSLEAEDITLWEGLPITTVARTIADVAGAHQAEDHIDLAIHQALRRGMTTRDKIQSQVARLSFQMRQRLIAIVEGVQL